MKTATILFFLIGCAYAWDSEQLEVFDVVEEVKENFYEMLNITKDAETQKIRSAFRRFSVLWHPDKNPNEDTSEKFRNLVSVYEVLKDPKKRGYYDEVLINGLPNWKSAMYYYRRVRKMGIFEGSVIVLCLATIIEYICAWAAYFENKYTQEQIRKTKKTKKNVPQVPAEEIPKPSFFKTLPFKIPMYIFRLIVSIPSGIVLLKEIIEEKRAAAREEEESEEEEETQQPKPKKRRQGFTIPEGPTFEIKQTNKTKIHTESSAPAPVSGGLWTDDDLAELVQLVKKYPGGTPKRWEVIAENIGRSVAEVTYMANKMKTNGYKMPAQEEEVVVEEKVKQKTKGGKLGGVVDESTWTQIEQKALEDALAKYPKGATDRWDRICELVPNKSKEECMLRFKHLVEMLKKQKEQ